jgi:hypothetical protein
MKISLKNFNPDKIAQLDLKMWKAYYAHNFFKLFILLLQLNHKFFKVSYISTLRTAYHSASAAMEFRLNKGNENIKKITEKLAKFFKIISERSLESFDYKKAAELELDWWLVDRYPNRYKHSREEALAKSMAYVFGVDSYKLKEYASYRAQAMVLRDEARKQGKAINWEAVEPLLNKSFNSLFVNVQ